MGHIFFGEVCALLGNGRAMDGLLVCATNWIWQTGRSGGGQPGQQGPDGRLHSGHWPPLPSHPLSSTFAPNFFPQISFKYILDLTGRGEHIAVQYFLYMLVFFKIYFKFYQFMYLSLYVIWKNIWIQIWSGTFWSQWSSERCGVNNLRVVAKLYKSKYKLYNHNSSPSINSSNYLITLIAAFFFTNVNYFHKFFHSHWRKSQQYQLPDYTDCQLLLHKCQFYFHFHSFQWTLFSLFSLEKVVCRCKWKDGSADLHIKEGNLAFCFLFGDLWWKNCRKLRQQSVS